MPRCGSTMLTRALWIVCDEVEAGHNIDVPKFKPCINMRDPRDIVASYWRINHAYRNEPLTGALLAGNCRTAHNIYSIYDGIIKKYPHTTVWLYELHRDPVSCAAWLAKFTATDVCVDDLVPVLSPHVVAKTMPEHDGGDHRPFDIEDPDTTIHCQHIGPAFGRHGYWRDVVPEGEHDFLASELATEISVWAWLREQNYRH